MTRVDGCHNLHTKLKIFANRPFKRCASAAFLLCQGSQEVVGSRNPSEVSSNDDQRGIMCALRRSDRRLGSAIRRKQAGIVPKGRVTYGRFNTDRRGATDDDQILHPERPKLVIELSFIERAPAPLFDNGVVSLWRELR